MHSLGIFKYSKEGDTVYSSEYGVGSIIYLYSAWFMYRIHVRFSETSTQQYNGKGVKCSEYPNQTQTLFNSYSSFLNMNKKDKKHTL